MTVLSARRGGRRGRACDPARRVRREAGAQVNPPTTNRVTGRRLFTGGGERDVYEDAEGRQYVLDGNGERVYGQWLWPADEPMVHG